jgi:hypothetical protein
VTWCSDDIDDNYLTTIERPCCVEHLDSVPTDIRVAWLTVKKKNLKNVISLHSGLAYGVLYINENLKPGSL